MKDSVQNVDFVVEILLIDGLPSISICIRKVPSSSLTYHLFFFMFASCQESCIGTAFVVAIVCASTLRDTFLMVASI